MAGEEAPTDMPLEENQTRHVPIRDGQEGGEAAPAGDTDPLAPPVAGDNYEMDKDRAEAMAYAETDFRTKAVQNRDVERPDPGLVEKRAAIEATEEQIDALESSRGHLRRRDRKRVNQLYSERNRLESELWNERSVDEGRRYRADTDTRGQLISEDLPKIGKDMSITDKIALVSPEKRAEFYDRQATRIGEWAGLLHDNPLSDEFKKAHPGVQFQPKGLVRMENEAEALENQIKRIEANPGHTMELAVTAATRGHDISGQSPETQRLLAEAGDKELDDEYERLTGELMDRAKALDDLHNRLVEQEEAQPLRDRLAMTRNLLNDVRREVGLPVEGEEAAESETEAEATDQPE